MSGSAVLQPVSWRVRVLVLDDDSAPQVLSDGIVNDLDQATTFVEQAMLAGSPYAPGEIVFAVADRGAVVSFDGQRQFRPISRPERRVALRGDLCHAGAWVAQEEMGNIRGALA